ncbi:MAG TPA: hypothetical protein VMW86_10310 [Dehalococcoidales bacterium]|nr:hypothetical protein [Dehalococcoidales bacterium]
MIKIIKEKFVNLIKGQDGIALPSVLAMFAVGSLLIVPSINYVATNLNTGSIIKEEFRGIVAADTGVEDALWNIKNDSPNFQEPYTLTDINGLSVDINIDTVDTIWGEIVDSGHHSEWISTTANLTYNAGIYDYTLAVSNNGSGNIRVLKILIDFPPNLDYEPYSTDSEILDFEPEKMGASESGIALVWEGASSMINPDETVYHRFQLNGPEGMEDEEGIGVIKTQRDDIGTVWIGDVQPYSITAEAKDGTETVITIRAGVLQYYSLLEINSWQIIR